MAADAKTYSVYKVLSELPSDLRNRVVQTVQREMTFDDLKAELEKVASLKTMQEAVDNKEKPKVYKVYLCGNLGGSRAPIDTSSLQLGSASPFLHSTWVPIHDEQNEGEWRDFYDNEVLNFTPPWFGSEPNGGTTENCAKAWGYDGWWDTSCGEPGTCVCERQPFFYLRLRGLCANSAIDKY